METVFSHIVQKRFSQVSEDVATDALAFILHTHESARDGMMKLLLGIAPSLPTLQFRTQVADGSSRPDMRGYEYDVAHPRIFVENKFWAGLTENQPVSYLEILATHTQPTVLLVVAPEAREHTLWRELTHRLEDAGISATPQQPTAGIVHSLATEDGPTLAITSWTKLLSWLELEVAEDLSARSDLAQLRALCEAADIDAFVPVAPEQVTDQRTPAFILQLSSIVQAAVSLAVSEGVLSFDGLRPMASWDRAGRYVRFSVGPGGTPWLGVHLGLWKTYGVSPLWLLFSQNAPHLHPGLHPLLEPWAAKRGVFTTLQDEGLAVALDLALGEDKDQVVRGVVDQLRAMAHVLSALNETPAGPDGG